MGKALKPLSRMWHRDLAVSAPTPERWRFPGKRWHFEESANLLIEHSPSDYLNGVSSASALGSSHALWSPSYRFESRVYDTLV